MVLYNRELLLGLNLIITRSVNLWVSQSIGKFSHNTPESRWLIIVVSRNTNNYQKRKVRLQSNEVNKI